MDHGSSSATTLTSNVSTAAHARRTVHTNVHSLSTESIAIPTQAQAGPAAQCASCGAPQDAEQRYCLECGERRASIRGLAASAPSATDTPAHTPAAPSRPPGVAPPQRRHDAANTPSVIAGVGVLLLAMGVGVLIGRSGNPTQAAQPTPQVITLTAPASSQQSPEAATTPSAGRAAKATKHSGGSRVGSSAKHPAPASVLDGLKGAKGKSYVEKSKNLPDVVSTG